MKAKNKTKHPRLQFCVDITIIVTILLIILVLVVTPNQSTKKQQDTVRSNQVLSSIATNSMLITVPPPTETPTPTPITRFRHSKWFFSFDLPESATAYETKPEEPKLVENSLGGAYVAIPNKLSAEIAVVEPMGQNLQQYFYNRLATTFNEKILSTKIASISGQLKGFEARLKDLETQENKILLFLPFRGNQFFEIEAVFPQKKHDKEEKIFFKTIETLKNY